MRKLEGRTGLVTGGASGIGLALATRLAEEGAQVAIWDRNAAAAETAAAKLRAGGGAVWAQTVDITSNDQVLDATHALAQRGPIWFMVHAAGWDEPKPFLSTTADEWARTLDINLVGAMRLHKAVCERMVRTGGGRIVSIASDAARAGAGNCSIYSAAKGGLIAFTKSLARELARDNVLLNTICPGPTETPLLNSFAGDNGARFKDALLKTIPLGRLARPEDYCGLATLLLSDDGAYITGQTFSVSGGLTMIG